MAADDESAVGVIEPVTVGWPSGDVEGQGSEAVAGVGDLGRARLGAVQHAKEVGDFVVMVQQETHPLRPLLAHAAGAQKT